eukprot:g11956.t1
MISPSWDSRAAQGYGQTEAEVKPVQPPPGVPRKCINTQQDLEIFTRSKLCNQLVSFVTELAEAAKGLPCDPARRATASPLAESSRNGSSIDRRFPAFVGYPMPIVPINTQAKTEKTEEKMYIIRNSLFVASGHAAAEHAPKAEALSKELSYYLRGAFGDERRLITSGLVAFLGVLFALGATGVLARTDAADAVLIVFADYVRLMRRLQKVYVLEPAGSHGVWGLDDYHMLPFLFGAAQLIGKEEEVPTGEVYREQIVGKYADQYLYAT